MSGVVAKKLDLSVSVNSNSLDSLLHASIATTNCFSADTFSVTLALGRFQTSDIGFWSATTSAYVEVKVAEDFGAVQQNLISGMADTILIDPICRTVAIEGRDLSASLIDSYRQQDFVNQTASEVVAQIAQSHDLTPIITPTSETVGRYYGDGYTRLSLGQFSRLRSDWDLVVDLARENRFDAFVQGNLLFFQSSNENPFGTICLSQKNIQKMRIERSLAISSDTTARVQSWDSQKMTSYDSGNTDAGSAENSVPNSNNQKRFLFSASNSTPSQVTGAADRLAAELGRLATVLHFDMPWDLRLAPRSRITFDDLFIFFGMTFAIDSIERRYSSSSGSTQSVRAVSV